MKKIISLFLSAVMVCACLGGCGAKQEGNSSPENKETVENSNSTGKEVLVMATNANFPPYEYHEGDSIVGIDAEIAGKIAEELGMELKIEDMAFDSILPAVESGKANFGMAGMTVTEDRLKSVNFSTSYATGIQVVIVKEDSDIKSVDDLFAEGASHRVGVQINTTGDIYTSDDIEAKGLGTIERYNNGADAVQALITGKIDCVVIDNEPAKSFVAANKGLVILPTEYITEDYAICFSKKDTELLDKVNAALEKLIADGTVKSIIDKYIPAE